MEQLTAEYVRGHIEPAMETAEASAEDLAPDADWGAAVYNVILQAAAEQLEKTGKSVDEMELDLKVRVRPQVLAEGDFHPLGGCIEVCVGVLVAQVCYHRGFKGKRPGEG